MLKKTITYTDYNGATRTEDFWFNLTEAEITEMQLGVHGGFNAMLNKIIAAQDTPTLIKIFKDLVLDAYGEKSADGRRFVKEDRDGYRLANDFKQTEAYSKLYMELATDADAAAKFVNGIVPAEISKQMAEQMKKELPTAVS